MTVAYDDTWKEMPCELWPGPFLLNGYGRVRDFQAAGKQMRVLAHQMTWEECFGDILVMGEVIGHKCDNPPCRQPLHLFKTTKSGNTQDMVEKGRHRNQNTQKTHCKNGHEFTPENTLVRHWRAKTQRTCRACRRGVRMVQSERESRTY